MVECNKACTLTKKQSSHVYKNKACTFTKKIKLTRLQKSKAHTFTKNKAYIFANHSLLNLYKAYLIYEMKNKKRE